jgi:predicted deacylase
VAGTLVPRGRRARIEIPVARLPTGTWASLPVEVLNGARDGPVVWLSAAIHGDELNGVDVILRTLRRLRPKELAGTVLCVPIVNVFGFIEQSRYLPDRRDLNRCFPGSMRGSMASRLARLFVDEVVRRCSFGIDLHSGSNHRENLPQVRADLDDADTRAMALAFGAPVALHSRPPSGSLRRAAAKLGVRTLLFEGGQALRFDRPAVDAGVRGVLRVLAAKNMIEPVADETPAVPTRVARGSKWMRAGRSGLFEPSVDLGVRVERGDTIGHVHDAFKESSLAVRAGVAGTIIGIARNPLVSLGEAVVHVAATE